MRLKQKIVKAFLALDKINENIENKKLLKLLDWADKYFWFIFLIIMGVLAIIDNQIINVACLEALSIISISFALIIVYLKYFFKCRCSVIKSGMFLYVINFIATVLIYDIFNFDRNILSPNQAIIIYAILWVTVSLLLEKKVAKLINQISVAVFGLIFTIGTYWVSVLPEDYIKNFLPINNNEIPFSGAEINRAVLQFFLIFLIYIAISTLTEVILNIRDYCVDKYGKDKLNDKE